MKDFVLHELPIGAFDLEVDEPFPVFAAETEDRLRHRPFNIPREGLPQLDSSIFTLFSNN